MAIHYEPKALWRSFIDAKYTKPFLGGIPSIGRYNNTVPMPLGELYGKAIQLFNKQIEWNINNGAIYLSFWNSAWNNNYRINLRYPALWSLSHTKWLDQICLK